ncbi:hypothetical protein LTR84_002416 [Exophiala bonariae]|uniref:Uncharacterized protein n=1 Tax=Exophiala bonariae TaxID=1690606 RepID=A0AAV9ND68_9EURO|nr:hypothetical protein LTR84_002416 [Exophiala bonariae]
MPNEPKGTENEMPTDVALASLQQVLLAIKQAEETRRSRNVAKRLEALIDFVHRYTAAVDATVQGTINPVSLTPFHRIIYTGPDVNRKTQEIIDTAVAYDKNVDKLNGFRENALYVSIAKGNARMVRCVLNTKCRDQLQIPSGVHGLRPLELAVCLSAEDVVEVLLDAGADVDSTHGRLEENCFHLCSRKSGSVAIAELLWERCRRCVESNNSRLFDKARKDGRMPYHLAVFQGHFELADRYGAKGAVVEAGLSIITWKFDQRDRILPTQQMLGDYHRTEDVDVPIMDLVLGDRRTSPSYICVPVSILGSMLPYKTDHTMARLHDLFGGQRQTRPNFIVCPACGLNAFHFVVAELYESFEERRACIDSISSSMSADAPLLFLLEKYSLPVQVSHQDTNGWTALHIAALNVNYQATALLLEAGGDPNMSTECGWTFLDCARIARDKWKSKLPNIHMFPVGEDMKNLKSLSRRADAVVTLLESRGAKHELIAGGYLTKLKQVVFSPKEWRRYTYLDAIYWRV